MNPKQVELGIRAALEKGLGLDLSDPNLEGTPSRIARMYCEEFFTGIGKEFHEFRVFPNKYGYDQIIMSDKIQFVSMCSHHFLPFEGWAWILYIPDRWLVGLSKLARLVDHYARRPQLQENLCHEVIMSFNREVHPKGCMVFLRGVHGCTRCRGVK